MRARHAALVAVSLSTVLLFGCSHDAKLEFCDELRDTYRLTELRDAIDRNDTATIEKSLQDLKDLADDAPEEITIDLHIVVNTVIDTVRSVTEVSGPGGEKLPPDLGKLNAALASVAKSSQHVVDYADQECELKLTR